MKPFPAAAHRELWLGVLFPCLLLGAIVPADSPFFRAFLIACFLILMIALLAALIDTGIWAISSRDTHEPAREDPR